MSVKKIQLIIILTLISLPALLLPQDGKVLSKIMKNEVLRVGTSGSQPPFSMRSKDGTLMGYDVDLAQMLADVMGVKLKLIEKPISELIQTMEKGEIDLILSGMTITAARNIKVSFVGPYIVSGKSLIAKSKRLDALDEMDELNRPSISVAAVTGSTSKQFLEELAPNVKLVPTKDYESGVKLVLNDKVDAMLADYPICVLSLLRYPDSGLAISEDLFTIEPIGIALPPEAFQLHNLIENYMTALQIGGTLAELETKWFQDGSWLIRLP